MQLSLRKELASLGVKPGEKVTVWVQDASIYIASPEIYMKKRRLQADNDMLY
jgi:hypothetical protein